VANYGISEGVDCRTGEPVYNKLSCQSLRIFPAPPGFWEQEVCLPIRADEGADGRRRGIEMMRAIMFGDKNFVPCQHPDCWICLGQKTQPMHGDLMGRPHTGRGILAGEEALFTNPKSRTPLQAFTEAVWDRGPHPTSRFVQFMRGVAKVVRAFRRLSKRSGVSRVELPACSAPAASDSPRSE
jgi:hypothetical protein